MQNVLSLVQIGITTKNRWDDLKVTLEKIRDFGLGDLRIVIFDDCSDTPCPYLVSAICPGAELKRFGISRGLIVRRNEIAAVMDAKYYLSLDDDSFPCAGSLEDAVVYAESLSDNFCLGFPYHIPVGDEPFEKNVSGKPTEVRSFIGCAHMLDRQRFLDLGGYREELIHQGEEMEIAVRAFQQGLVCRRFPGLLIIHVATSVGRSYYRMDYYGSRNTLLWNDWYLPPVRKVVKQGRALAMRLLAAATSRRAGHLRGSLAGLQDVQRLKRYRHSMTADQYRRWQKLPLY